MYEKYAFIAPGMIPYGDAGPVSGNVPPIVIVRLVMPVSDAADVALDAVTPSAATSAAAKSTTFFIPGSSWEVCRCARGERNGPSPRLPIIQTTRRSGGLAALYSPSSSASRSASSSSSPSASSPLAQMDGSVRSRPTIRASSSGAWEPPARSRSRYGSTIDSPSLT